eukprot:1377694-Amorphochlora_amoeboformis.AAC.1
MQPLMAAAYSNHPRLVQLLTSRKAKVNLQSNNLLGRHSALALAVAREHEDVVKLLLDAKADTQAQSFLNFCLSRFLLFHVCLSTM